MYPLPILWEVSLYKEANIALNTQAVHEFSSQGVFYNTSINEKVDIFNNTVLNILNDFIPHEAVICDGKDLTWFKRNNIKRINLIKNAASKNYHSNSGKINLESRWKHVQFCLNSSIESSKKQL